MANALTHGAETLRHYEIHAWVLMPNHVHLLASPTVDPASMLRTLKGGTARACNKVLKRTGAFRQAETYDRAVRNAVEFGRIVNYIEMNPVRAGLCSTQEEWRWSSAYCAAQEGS